MQDHTVSVDTTKSPAVLAFAPVFNVAVPFIDRHLGEGRGEKVAVRTDGGEAVTYGQLAANVSRAGNALRGLGIAPGERMLMMVKDCPEFFYLFWGAIKAGIVPVPLNTLFRARDYAFIVGDSGCAGVAYSPEFEAEVAPALVEVGPEAPRAIPVEGEGITLRVLMEEASPHLDPVPAAAGDDCFWLYSSGTTGSPKGTVHAHRDMVVTSQFYGLDTLGMGEDDVCFSAAKLFFAYGLGNGMTFPLWAGASAVLLAGPPSPQATFEVIEKFRPTLFFGVPTLYAAQLHAMETADPDLSSLRLCVSAAEPLPGDLLRRWKARAGTDILDGIGSTEALHIYVSNRPGDIRPGASGKPVPGYDARVDDGTGNQAAAGDMGRLMIRGDSVAKYYWNNPERTAATMVAGWLDTGDTYLRDEDGYYHYCGRNDDMLKVGGIWCSPFEIEARLVEHPAVLEAAVVGRADAEGLIKPEAFVVLKEAGEDRQTMTEALLDHCKDGLARYKYPRWVTFVDALPKTATGKIRRFKLRQQPE